MIQILIWVAVITILVYGIKQIKKAWKDSAIDDDYTNFNGGGYESK